jgi:Flp pilus assembly protein TadG
MRRRLVSDERGVVLPLVALMLVVLCGMGALAVDVGNAYLHKRRLQQSVDLAALAAAQALPNTGQAINDANSFAQANWTKHDTGAMTTTVTTGCKVSGCATPDSVTVSATASVPTTFASVLGISSLPVKATATACGPCDSSPQNYDVMVVLDRSYSMCLNANGSYNSCFDLDSAIAGIKSLLGFFDPVNDRVGFAALTSGDSNHTYSSNYPCDTSSFSIPSGKGDYYGSLGDFMDGTAASHDSWVLAPLQGGFKNADGSLKSSNQLVSAVNCVQSKGWTALAPAVQAATNELVANGRTAPGIQKAIVVFSDGGSNSQPMKRDSNGNPLTTASWYTPSAGNNLKPCHDAVGQAGIAKSNGIAVYTIGYDLTGGDADTCYTDNHPSDSRYIESGIDARSTLQQMATDAAHFYEKASAGDVYSIFNAIGHSITSGGVRLIG